MRLGILKTVHQRLAFPILLDGGGQVGGVGQVPGVLDRVAQVRQGVAFASEAAALIADAVRQGMKFSRITCYSWASSHRRLSNHHTGDAFDSHPSIPARLVRAHGLRSGCDFGDCPHVDNARNVGGVAFWNSVKHREQQVIASAERRHHRRVRVARR